VSVNMASNKAAKLVKDVNCIERIVFMVVK
jgi:hypothetical protein